MSAFPSKSLFLGMTAVLLLAGTLLPGCGGGDKPSAKLKVKPEGSLKVVSTAPSRSAAPVVTLPKPKKDPTVNRELREGETLFALLKEPNPSPNPQDLFTDDPALTGGNVDRFSVTIPPTGQTSTSFVVTSSTATDHPGGTPIPSGIRFPAGFAPLKGHSGPSGPDGLPSVIRCLKDGSIMALVPAGSFTRGSDTGPPDARPSQRVGLDHYYIDIHEISNSQFEQCRDALRREKKAVPRAAERKPRDQSEPVMGVSWSDAIAYSRWAGKELATEAQWEKAARGPEGFEFPWGNGVPLWHRLRRSGQIDPVGSFPADKSFYGVFDMAGNAREWCADWYSPTTYQDAARKGEARGGIQNPPGSAGPEADRSRVVRGGDAHWRVWPRGHAPQVDRPIDVGFRCVLTFRPDRKSGESNKAPGR